MNAYTKLACLGAVALAIAADPASALTIQDYEKGGIYTLDVTSLGGERYAATYTIDFSSVPLGIPATSLNQIEFKVANAYEDPISVTSAPESAGNWIPKDGPLNGSGCGGNNDGFVCLSASTPLSLGSTQSFSWTVEFGAKSLLPVDDWHIGARYTSPRHEKGWVVSLPGSTAVPEPASGLLFGAGLMIVGTAARKRLD
jgi:hypothetical protein